MADRDGLDELHSLAEAISQDAHGWRQHRRERALARAHQRLEAQMLAPTKRRGRHRMLAASVVVVFAAALAIAGLQIRQHARHHPPPLPSIADTVPGYQLPDVRAGREAAAALAAEGRASDVFSCQQWFDSHGFGTNPTTSSIGWHEVFMRSCLNTSSPSLSDG